MSRETFCNNCGAWIKSGAEIDHDAICQACDINAELVANKILDRAAETLAAALDDANAAILHRMTPTRRRAIVMECLDDGRMFWKIN